MLPSHTLAKENVLPMQNQDQKVCRGFVRTLQRTQDRRVGDSFLPCVWRSGACQAGQQVQKVHWRQPQREQEEKGEEGGEMERPLREEQLQREGKLGWEGCKIGGGLNNITEKGRGRLKFIKLTHPLVPGEGERTFRLAGTVVIFIIVTILGVWGAVSAPPRLPGRFLVGGPHPLCCPIRLFLRWRHPPFHRPLICCLLTASLALLPFSPPPT